MNSAEFLSEIVVPNLEALTERPSDTRLAINAIMAADAFFGINFEEQKNAGTNADIGDEKYRESVARKSQCYRVLRDAAAAIKHGELDKKRKKIRLVRSANQTKKQETIWNDDAKWNDAEKWADKAVIVETEIGERVRVDTLVKEVVRVAEEEINHTGRTPARLADILSVLN
jgi:hypothetical protein